MVNLGGSIAPITLPLARSTVSETDTIVRVTDGNIVAIGGLMSVDVRDNRGGIPGLSGRAAAAQRRPARTRKRELVILLKPTVLVDDRAWAEDLRETQRAHPSMTLRTRAGARADELPAATSACASRLSASRRTRASSSRAAARQQALNTLLIAVANGEGFIKITGEVGTGKTLLCRKFLATLDDGWVVGLHPESQPRAAHAAARASPRSWARGVDPGVDQHRLLKAITRAPARPARAERKRVLLCMDESQAMPLETLEALRLLTNLETEKRKLLQVVLFGQPELDRKLAPDPIRQLRQRITFQYDLQGARPDEVAATLRIGCTWRATAGSAAGAAHDGRSIAPAGRAPPRQHPLPQGAAPALRRGREAARTRHIRIAAHDTPAAQRPSRWPQWLRLPLGSSAK